MYPSSLFVFSAEQPDYNPQTEETNQSVSNSWLYICIAFKALPIVEKYKSFLK
jgi:hypothetical protein